MREIKFRGYNKENKKWLESMTIIKDKNKYFIMLDELQNGELKPTLPVEEASIGQYTGFKDKNGVEIYEGDLVKELEEDADSYYVEFDEEYGIWQVYDVIQKCPMFKLGLKQMIINNCKIVGNIYEEKLKEDK